METKQIISWLLDKAARAQDHSYARMLNQAAKRLKELEEKQRWIPVAERLPELYQECFVLVKMKYEWEKDYEYNVDSGCYVGEHGYIGNFNTNNDWNEGQDDIQITHWMPLPEPPKEVEGGKNGTFLSILL